LREEAPLPIVAPMKYVSTAAQQLSIGRTHFGEPAQDSSEGLIFFDTPAAQILAIIGFMLGWAEARTPLGLVAATCTHFLGVLVLIPIAGPAVYQLT